MEISFRTEKTRKETSIRQRERLSSGPSFSAVLQEKVTNKPQIHQQLEELDEQAQKLVESRTLEELQRYKQLLRRLVQTATEDGYALQTLTSRDGRRIKQHRLIRQMDEHLLELTEMILEKEAPRVLLLAKVDQIRGLLIHLCL